MCIIKIPLSAFGPIVTSSYFKRGGEAVSRTRNHYHYHYWSQDTSGGGDRIKRMAEGLDNMTDIMTEAGRRTDFNSTATTRLAD